MYLSTNLCCCEGSALKIALQCLLWKTCINSDICAWSWNPRTTIPLQNSLQCASICHYSCQAVRRLVAVKHIGSVKGSNWWAGILCPMWLGDIYSDRYSRPGVGKMICIHPHWKWGRKIELWIGAQLTVVRIGLVALIDNDHRLTSREQGDGNAV